MESSPLETAELPGTGWPTSRPAALPPLVRGPRTTDPAVRARLRLQRRAAAVLRRHLIRAIGRIVVLLAADLGAFALTRAALHAIRDSGLLGAPAATAVSSILPPGILVGIQYGAALFISLAVTGSYGPGDQRRNARRLFVAATLATALPLWTALWVRGVQPVLVQYAVTTGLMWLALVAERFTIDRAVAAVLPATRGVPALFVGSAENCARAMATRVFRMGRDYRVLGFVDIDRPVDSDALGHIAQFHELLQRSHAEAVVVCGHLNDTLFHAVVDAAVVAGTQILAVPRAMKVAGVTPSVVWRNGDALIELTAPALKGRQMFLKRLLDIVGVTLLLLALSPLFALIAALIKLVTRGPVFFTQERVGRGGDVFRILKFRTMVDGAESSRDALLSRSLYSDPRLFKVPDDPRVTTFGRWLRRTSLDELPQFINVLRGEMSLVGPRPPLTSEVALYESHHYARFGVTPGITGPWQVSGRSAVTDFEHVVQLETEYIKKWSLTKDLWILLRTVPVVLGRRGAH